MLVGVGGLLNCTEEVGIGKNFETYVGYRARSADIKDFGLFYTCEST